MEREDGGVYAGGPNVRPQFFLPLLFLLLSLGVQADVIHLQDAKLEGTIIAESKTHVTIRLAAGEVTVARKNIQRITRGPSPLELYQQMHLRLADNDVDGHYALALWCRDRELREQKLAQLRKVIEIDPNHERARRLLGHVRHEGKWMSVEAAKKAQGLVRYEGEWMKPAAAARRRSRATERKWAQRVARLLDRIRYGTPVRRRMAEKQLRAIRAPDAVHALRDALLSELQNAQLAAVEALREIDDDRVDEILVETVLLGPEPETVTAATAALRTRRRRHGVSALIRMLRHFTTLPVRKEEDRALKQQILSRSAAALGELGQPRAIPALIDSIITKVELPAAAGAGGSSITRGTFTTVPVYDPTRGIVHYPIQTGGVSFRAGPESPGDEKKYFTNLRAIEALKTLTGQDFGSDFKKWRQWWEKTKPEMDLDEE